MIYASDPDVFEIDRHFYDRLFDLDDRDVAERAFDTEVTLVIVEYHLRVSLVYLCGDPVPDAIVVVNVSALKLRYLLVFKREVFLADSAVSQIEADL